MPGGSNSAQRKIENPEAANEVNQSVRKQQVVEILFLDKN
jgi:hypothetical protein